MTSQLIGAYLERIGRKNFVIIGCVLMILSTVGFGLLSFIKANDCLLFFGLAITLRFVQGIAEACVVVSAYSIISFEFQKNREQYIGYAQASSGIGLMVGPVLGSVIYSNLNFQRVFYVFGGILLAGSILVILILP